MRVIHVTRKPIAEGNVAANVLAHGTGALHIAACRIATSDDLNGGAYSQGADARHDGAENWRFKRGEQGGLAGVEFKQPSGRWPPNLILGHLPGCRRVGETKIQTHDRPHPKNVKGTDGAGGQSVYEKYAAIPGTNYGFADANGEETVEVWECLAGCPVAGVDEQSGWLHPSGNKSDVRTGLNNDYDASSYHVSYAGRANRDLRDAGGGASRFFFRVHRAQDQTSMNIPQDLVDYLRTMITPDQIGGESLIALDLNAVDWAAIADGQYHGVIARGEPTAEQVEHLWRVVKPGGHVMLIAPDERPTGHVGACALEDAGFEIRDAILFAGQEGDGDKLHYVAKANARERNAGCEALADRRTGAPLYFPRADLDEDSLGEIQQVLLEAGLAEDVVENVAEMGLPKDQIPDEIRKHFKKQEKGKKYGNNHPCLHPAAFVMTESGFRSAKDVQIGDKVYSADGAFHAVTWISRHPYTSPNLFEVAVLGTNLTTLVTDNHPFLIWRPERDKKGNVIRGAVQWAEAAELRKGDYTLTPLLIEDLTGLDAFPERFRAPEFWFLAGLYAAEGSLQRAGHGLNVYPSYTLHVDETDLVDAIRAFFEPGATVSVYPKPDSQAVQVMAFDPEAGEAFRRLVGTGSGTKTLDPLIWRIGAVNQRAFLEGYMAGDGGEVRTYLQAKTVSPDLASQVCLLGDALGYKSNLFRDEAKPGRVGDREFKSTQPPYQIHLYSRNQGQTTRKPSRPTYIEHEGHTFLLRYVQAVSQVPYRGDVVSLSVEGSPTFQTAVGMSHNTVKPKEVLKRLLRDVPAEATVLDPFMGSGSMGLACLDTKHSYIGIEKEAEYLEIADARVRHWNVAKAAWDAAEVVSEAQPQTDGAAVVAEADEGSLFDMFGGGE